MSKKIAVRVLIKAIIMIIFWIVFGGGLMGCSNKESEPDAVAVNSTPSAQAQRLAEFDAVEKREAKYGYQSPEAGWGDSAGYRWSWLKNNGHKAAVTVGKLIGMFVFHLLLWVIPFLIITFIPGFVTGLAEMLIEGGFLILVGILMLAGNWVGELGVAHWVWICLILPGAILIVSSFVTKEGWWKIGVVFGGQFIMTLATFLGWLDTAMSALIHGSLFALACVAFVIYAFTRDDDKKASGEAASH